jgi:sterol desaturase/sphingolipid hydroxylase (fatty acid hydroxylase superfamily)
MSSIREQFLLMLAMPLYLLVIGGEMIISQIRHQQTYTFKDTVQNLYLMLFNSGVDFLFRLVYLSIWGYCYQYKLVSIESSIGYWLSLVIALDFCYYWLHRADHSCRLFWAVHVTHHSSEKFNFTVGFRSSVFEPLYRFLFFLPLPFLGFKPLDIAFVYSACQIWGILIHTEKVGSLGWLEYVLVTPTHHRVHHASNPLYLDKNIGMLLIWWDKLFGTFQPAVPESEYQAFRYGLTQPLQQETPAHIVFHEWKNIYQDLVRKDIDWKQKWHYIWKPPGWSHDGSRKTSEMLRREEQNSSPAPSISARTY